MTMDILLYYFIIIYYIYYLFINSKHQALRIFTSINYSIKLYLGRLLETIWQSIPIRTKHCYTIVFIVLHARTVVMGYGHPPVEQFSTLVTFVLLLGLGLPAILVIVGTICIVCQRVQRNKNDLYLG